MTPAALATLHRLTFETTRTWSEAEFATLLGQKGVSLCADNTGFALIRVILDEAELLTIATHPDHQRLGHANARLAEAERSALAAGASVVFLEVAENNHAARALYDAAGYTQVGSRPGYYATRGADPVAALVLRKPLVDRLP